MSKHRQVKAQTSEECTSFFLGSTSGCRSCVTSIEAAPLHTAFIFYQTPDRRAGPNFLTTCLEQSPTSVGTPSPGRSQALSPVRILCLMQFWVALGSRALSALGDASPLPCGGNRESRAGEGVSLVFLSPLPPQTCSGSDVFPAQEQ